MGWSIAVLTIAGLIVLIRLRKKSRDQKNLEPLLSFAREYNTEISDYDTWNRTLIGLDNKETKSLFFIRNIPGRIIREKINLSEVSDCRMYKTERKVKYHNEFVNVVDRIEVNISFYNHQPGTIIEFYNADYDQLTLSGELQLAQKWSGMIKDNLNPQVGKSKIAKNRRAKTHVEKESVF